MNNTQSDLAKASKNMLLEKPFYGLFLIGLNKKFAENIPTAGVSKNGINFQLTINPKFFDTLTDNQKVGVLTHEILHIAFSHLMLRESFSDYELFNIAAD